MSPRPLIRACPSPTGGNRNKLFLLQGRVDEPLGAFDEALGSKYRSENVKQLHEWCINNLAGHEIAELAELLTHHADLTPANAGNKQQYGMDANSRSMSPAEAAEYGRRYVEQRFGAPMPKANDKIAALASRIQVDNFNVPVPQKVTAPSQSALNDFHRRYPDAARIKAI